MEGFSWIYVWQSVTVALLLGGLAMLKQVYTVAVQLKAWSEGHEKLDNARFELLLKREKETK
jgi:hypothetical protein